MAPNNEENDKPLRITNRQVYDILNDVRTDIKLINQKLNTEIAKNDNLLADHEARIRKIEETVWRSAWISGLISAVITSAVGAILITTITRG
jgi:hypothetical protein